MARITLSLCAAAREGRGLGKLLSEAKVSCWGGS